MIYLEKNTVNEISVMKKNDTLKNEFLMEEKKLVSSLRADTFVKTLTPEINWSIIRKKLLDCNFNELIS